MPLLLADRLFTFILACCYARSAEEIMSIAHEIAIWALVMHRFARSRKRCKLATALTAIATATVAATGSAEAAVSVGSGTDSVKDNICPLLAKMNL